MTEQQLHHHHHHPRLLCFRLGSFSSTVQLLFLSIGVFVFYLLYGYFQELIFRLPGFRDFGFFLTLVQFAFYTIFSFLERKATGDHGRKIPLSTYLQIAFYTVGTMGLSNSSVGYLNYPTQVIFKCCKLIPVLIGGILIQGKRYGVIDFISAALMSIGLVLFSLADSQLTPNFNIKGYVLISLALVADAVIGNVQEKAMKSHGASNNEVIFYSYSIGFLYILFGTGLTGEFLEAFLFCLKHPVETYGYALIFSMTGYLGVNIVLTLVRQFGAFIAVTVTTCRKAVTIILSFILFSKPFTIRYLWSGLLVLFGIYLNVYSKNRTSWNQSVISLLKTCVNGCKYLKAVIFKSSYSSPPQQHRVVDMV